MSPATRLRAPGGQTCVTSVKTGTPSLGALDGQLDCGVPYQIDVYNDDTTTTAMIAGKKLYAPGNPPESHVNPGLWKFVCSECVDEQDPIPVEIDPPADTKPTCDAMGSVEYPVGTGCTWIEYCPLSETPAITETPDWRVRDASSGSVPIAQQPSGAQ